MKDLIDKKDGEQELYTAVVWCNRYRSMLMKELSHDVYICHTDNEVACSRIVSQQINLCKVKGKRLLVSLK